MNKNNLYDHNVYQKQEYKVRLNYKIFSHKIIYPSRAVGTVRRIQKGPEGSDFESRENWKNEQAK